MKNDSTAEIQSTAPARGNQVQFPVGILGFEQFKNYMLLAKPAEMPFAWLRASDSTSPAFVVINPFLIMPDYVPNIPESDVEFLGLKDANDALLFSIVTLRGPGRASVNLKGPLVINRHTHVGKQVIIANANDYSVEHPLPVAAAVA